MKIAVCEEDSKDRAHYSCLLKKYSELLKMKNEVYQFESGGQFLFDLEDIAPFDIVFLGIHMKNPDGIDVAHRLREQHQACEIIFLSNDFSRICEAFDVYALSYLVKSDTSDARFREVFENAVRRVQYRSEAYIMLSCAGEVRRVRIRDIEYLKVSRNTIEAHFDYGKPFIFYAPLSRMEAMLQNWGFIRAHRSYLVSIDHIQSVLTEELEMQSGERIPVSRSDRDATQAAFIRRNKSLLDVYSINHIRSCH